MKKILRMRKSMATSPNTNEQRRMGGNSEPTTVYKPVFSRSKRQSEIPLPLTGPPVT